MNNNQQSGGSNNFFSGFLLGALIGGLIVFLLGTKKGKKLLEAISEEGIENISNILDRADKSLNDNEVKKDEELSLTNIGSSVKPDIEDSENMLENAVEKPTVRRFFRGISKRVN